MKSTQFEETDSNAANGDVLVDVKGECLFW